MDGTYFIEPKTTISKQHGELKKADSLVGSDFEPANNATWKYLRNFSEVLGIVSRRESSTLKRERCLSDFLVAARYSKTGLIGWPSASDNFTDGPYTAAIMREVRDALCAQGFLKCVQKSSKADGLGRVYAVDPSYIPEGLRFRPHGIGPAVVVRGKKVRKTSGEKRKGRRLSRAQFEPKFTEVESKVKRVNALNADLPLSIADGHLFGPIRRIYNNGSMLSGGRCSGNWQQVPEIDRYGFKIAGEQVCEIDLKGSYVNICHAIFGGKYHLGKDPYLLIEFVRNADVSQAKKMRNMAKDLVSCFISNGGTISQFPKGEKKKGVTTSFKDKYGLPKKSRVASYINQILEAFPKLRELEGSNKCIMNAESDIFFDAIFALCDLGIPSYPMHDCLIVRLEDRETVIEALQASLKLHLGFVPDLDISYLGDNGEVLTSFAARPKGELSELSKLSGTESKNDEVFNDDYDVLEDF